MTKAHLSACPACARHVRVSESACPFGHASLSDDFRARPAPRAPRSGLSRAALYALGASAVALSPGCVLAYGGPAVEVGDASIEDASRQGVDAAYGGPPLDASHDGHAPIVDAAPDAPLLDSGDDSDTPVVDAAYGGPPLDASE